MNQSIIGKSLAEGLASQNRRDLTHREARFSWSPLWGKSVSAQFTTIQKDLVRLCGSGVIGSQERGSGKDREFFIISARPTQKGGFILSVDRLNVRDHIIKNRPFPNRYISPYASRHCVVRMVQDLKTNQLSGLGKVFLPHALASREGITATMAPEGICLWTTDTSAGLTEPHQLATTWIPASALDAWAKRYARCKEGLEVPGAVWVDQTLPEALWGAIREARF